MELQTFFRKFEEQTNSIKSPLSSSHDQRGNNGIIKFPPIIGCPENQPTLTSKSDTKYTIAPDKNNNHNKTHIKMRHKNTQFGGIKGHPEALKLQFKKLETIRI